MLPNRCHTITYNYTCRFKYYMCRFQEFNVSMSLSLFGGGGWGRYVLKSNIFPYTYVRYLHHMCKYSFHESKVLYFLYFKLYNESLGRWNIPHLLAWTWLIACSLQFNGQNCMVNLLWLLYHINLHLVIVFRVHCTMLTPYYHVDILVIHLLLWCCTSKGG